MYATNYFEDLMLNLVAQHQSITAPTRLYLELFQSNPGDEGTGGTPISYSGYARQQIVFTEPAAEGNGLSMQNTAQISFSESPINAGTVQYVGVYDSLSGGNLLLYGQLDTPLVVNAQVSPVFRAGSIKWIWSGNLSAYYRRAIMNILRGTNLIGFDGYLGLHNGDNEFAGNNYARIPVSFTRPEQQASGADMISNAEEITSSIATGNWGTLNRVVIYDALTNGHAYAEININSISMTTGYAVLLHAGDLQFSIN